MRQFFVVLFCISAFFVQAQTPDLNSVKESITTLADNFPQEKMYLHFDKPAYAPGETVWFKAYLATGVDPSNISKTLYIDFIDVSGKLLKHCIEPIYDASASGDFNVPLEYKNQTVFVKAYTRWMLNFDSTFFYRKPLQIVQAKPSLNKSINNIEKTEAKFLPEGGDLIDGIESKIAFKAVGFDGRPATIKGVVHNAAGQQVAEIKTEHDGMGSFLLTPKAGEVYTAKWKDASGNSYETILPDTKQYGATIQIKLQDKTRGFVIQRSQTAPDNFKKVYIAATMQQHLVYLAAANLADNFVTGGAIPVSELPSGILQVTLFDSAFNAVAERVTFINNNDYFFTPEAGFAQLGTDKRKPNTLVIDVPDTLATNLSVSVTDANVGIDSSDDIISRLLLTADLKGNIFHPSYYFKNDSNSLQQQLDLVMLTNGWRRIDWQNVVNNKWPVIKYVNDTEYINLSGKIFGATPQDLRQGAMIMLMTDNTGKKDSTRKLEQALIDANATFSKPDFILFDTTKVYYRVSGSESFANSSSVTFNNSMPSNKIVPWDTMHTIFFADTATENFRRRLAIQEMANQRMRLNATLQDVVVTTKAKSPMQVLDEKYTSGLFSSGDSYQFDLMTDPFSKSATDIFTYLQGKVAGLLISGGSGGSTPSVSWRGGTPSFYYNESPVDVSMLSTINVNDIAYVKVFRPPFFGTSSGGASGAIAVYTKKGGDVQQPDKGKGLPYKMIIGYTSQKEFYSPDYASFNTPADQDDMRTTLYWNPMILTTPENHSIRLHFYNNDFTQSFRVIVEGMRADGKLAHIEKVIE